MKFKIDPAAWAELSELLDRALDLPPDARSSWLESLDARHGALKPRLRAILACAADVETDDFLRALPTIEADPSEATGEHGEIIGPYRLLREIGAGGMGTVWLAERTDGIMNRRVALKLPNVTGGRAGLAERIGRERDILATLNHPSIATLYDAGMTAAGQPFLALEYVEGREIDDYCRATGLDLRGRLRLFLQVADAVAYAHAKLVVHRDLKPSNMLVTADGQVRLLDFGIAKLLEDGAAGRTLLTEIAGRALTPDYASPEQIVGEPITIASDVYSLGVILYELLTGTRPYRLKRDSRGALEDAIVQADPAKPSDVAPPQAARALRGDLDTIVLKALKKRPADRYATVNAFADDLQRFLDSRPVLAQPDSAGYRLRKFVARNRIAVAAGSISALLVLAGTVGIYWQGRVAVRERDRAEVVRAFLESIFRDADPYAESGKVLTAQQLLLHAGSAIESRFAERPDVRIELQNLVGSSLANLGDTTAARANLERAVAAATLTYGRDHPVTVESRALLANVHSLTRDVDALRAEVARLLPLARRHAASHPRNLVRVLRLEVDLAFLEGRYEAIDQPAREAFELARRTFGDHHPEAVALSSLLAESSLFGFKTLDYRLAEMRRGLEFALAAYGDTPAHAQVIRMREVYSRGLSMAGHYREAIVQGDLAIAAADALFGPNNRLSTEARVNVAAMYRRVGELRKSLEYSGQALDVFATTIETRSADFANALTGRGTTLVAARRPRAALADLAAAEATYAELFGPKHWDTVTAAGNRAVALAYMGRFDEAEGALDVGRDPEITPGVPMWLPYIDGVVKRLAGDPEAAAVLLARADSLIAPGPRADWDRVRVVAERGLAEVARGRMYESRRWLLQANELHETLRIAMHPTYADVLTGVGQVELLAGRAESARPWLQRAERFWLAFDPENHAGGETAYWLARCDAQLGHAAQARSGFARAARLLAASPLPRDQQLARAARQGR